MSTPPTASPELKARILEAVRASPSPARGSLLGSLHVVLPAATVLAGCLYFAFDGVRHGEGRPPWALSATIAIWVGAALVSLWSVVGPSRSPTGRPRAWLLSVALGVPALVLLFLIGVSSAAASSAPASLIATHRAGVRCLLMTLAAAAGPVLAFLFIRRGSDPLHPVAHGAAIGASFGAYAGIMVCLWCPDLSAPHAAIGHVFPLVLLAALGAVVGARVLDLPRERSNRGP
jgi:hypothetical protein